MAIYPMLIPDLTSPYPEYHGPRAIIPFDHDINYLVLNSEFADGVERRRLLWGTPRRNININYPYMSYADSRKLIDFYKSNYGSFGSFSFYYPQVETYTKELAGVLENTLGHPTPLLSISLPSKFAQSYTLYRNDVALVETVEYVFTSAGGTDREDIVTFTSAYVPAVGDVYTFSFTGYLRIKARFESEPLQIQDVKTLMSRAVVTLRGLEPDLIT